MIDFIINSVSLSTQEVKERVASVAYSIPSGESTTISVYPKYIESAALALGDSCNVTLCAICPASEYSYPEVTALECSMAVENGADQIEVAIDNSLETTEAEEYLRIISQEVEDVAELSILVNSRCADIKKAVEQGLKAATDLGATTLSYGLEEVSAKDVAEVAGIVARYNEMNSENEPISLRLVANITLDSIEMDVAMFMVENKLEELVESNTLILRIPF